MNVSYFEGLLEQKAHCKKTAGVYTILAMDTQVAASEKIQDAISLLKSGVPVAFPTETVYGLGAPVFSHDAIQKIFSIKGRPQDNPLIVHVATIEDVGQIAQDLPPSFFELADRFWPGPLTLVVKKRPEVPSIVSAGLSTIAVRMPSHQMALALIQAVGPIAAPSANLSGRPSPTCALDAFEDLNGKIPLILDGGSCAIGIESTVLNISGDTLQILRPGAVTKEELEEFLGEKVLEISSSKTPLSPGMKYRHYSPKAKVSLVFQEKDLKGPCILSPRLRPNALLLDRKTLFAEFRNADRQGIHEIEIDCTDPSLIDPALMNRLLKAAGN